MKSYEIVYDFGVPRPKIVYEIVRIAYEIVYDFGRRTAKSYTISYDSIYNHVRFYEVPLNIIYDFI